MTPTIDPEFSALIPPLTPDELEQLEENILRDGVREPLVVWDGLLIDGHNRLAICQKRRLPYEVIETSFSDRAQACIWIIKNQFGRRNLKQIVRIDLAEKLEEMISAKAKARQAHGKTAPGQALPPNFAEASIDTRAEVAKLAGVSPEQYRKGKQVLAQSPAPVVQAVRSGAVSIHSAHKALALPIEVQEHAVADPAKFRQVVKEEVAKHQQEQSKRKENSDWIRQMNASVPAGYDRKKDEAQMFMRDSLITAINEIADLPPVEEFISNFPDYLIPEFQNLDKAAAYLAAFAATYKEHFREALEKSA